MEHRQIIQRIVDLLNISKLTRGVLCLVVMMTAAALLACFDGHKVSPICFELVTRSIV
jgi:hypothetical protein